MSEESQEFDSDCRREVYERRLLKSSDDKSECYNIVRTQKTNVKTCYNGGKNAN